MKTTIFVHSMTNDDLYSFYFGDAFLSGKRIFTKDDIPTFEGGLTYYTLNLMMHLVILKDLVQIS